MPSNNQVYQTFYGENRDTTGKTAYRAPLMQSVPVKSPEYNLKLRTDINRQVISLAINQN
jgi:hypothetical protein